MNSVNAQLADEWGLRLMHIYQLGGRNFETWVFAPGERPQRV